MTTTKTPTSRVRNVQTPGEVPKVEDNPQSGTVPGRAAEVEHSAMAQTDELEAQRVNAFTTDQDAPAGPDGIVVADPADSVVAKENGIPEDVMALARAQVNAELGAELAKAAKSLQPTTVTPQSRSDYRKMRAADIDATKLSAPVFTLDGWLCPPAPAGK